VIEKVKIVLLCPFFSLYIIKLRVDVRDKNWHELELPEVSNVVNRPCLKLLVNDYPADLKIRYLF